MAKKIAATFKAKLSEIIGIGHRQFGKVALRRPFDDDDDEGGEGGTGLQLEEHPFLAQQPIGAASDLTAIANQNSQAEDEAKERVNEASLQLQKSPTLQAELNKQFGIKPSGPST